MHFEPQLVMLDCSSRGGYVGLSPGWPAPARLVVPEAGKMRRKGIRLSPQDFESEVARALEDIPEPFAKMLDNVAIVVEDEPDAETRAAHGPILGLYEGVPLTAGTEGFEPSIPPCITIFQRPHERACQTLTELRSEIRETVLHEVAHQFGMDDSDLDALGPLRPQRR